MIITLTNVKINFIKSRVIKNYIIFSHVYRVKLKLSAFMNFFIINYFNINLMRIVIKYTIFIYRLNLF